MCDDIKFNTGNGVQIAFEPLEPNVVDEYRWALRQPAKLYLFCFSGWSTEHDKDSMDGHSFHARRPPKKICKLYDQLFQANLTTATVSVDWAEFFLLWADGAELSERVSAALTADLDRAHQAVSQLTRRCVEAIGDERSVRAVNALQTLTVVLRAVSAQRLHGVDLTELLFDENCAEQLLKTLTTRLCQLLLDDCAAVLKQLSLRLLLTLATVRDDIDDNTLLEYVLISNVFEALIELLGNSALRVCHGESAVLLLTLLVNYRKFENVNPYIVKLSILDDDLALNGYSQTISLVLSDHNRYHQQGLVASQPQGVLSSFTSMVGQILVADDAHLDSIKSDESLLLAMYEAVHLNRNFITTLISVPPRLRWPTFEEGDVQLPAESGAMGGERLPSALSDANLLVAFLTYCSVVLQDLKTERSRQAAKLCAIVLTCITEDQYANSLMHDVNVAFRVSLYRAPMRHRKGAFERAPSSRPIAATVLDLCAEFIVSHLMRSLPFELYLWILGVVQRILCHQKKCRVRLDYRWRDLWNALIALLRFVAANDALLADGTDAVALCQRAVTLLNLFVTFGDTFLPAPADYDQLYYEIVRQADVFDQLHAFAVRRANGESEEQRGGAARLATQLANVRAIAAHLRPKVAQLQPTALTEDQVLQVVRANYDSLTLKLFENLDVFERYNEKPGETAFFASLVHLIVAECRNRLASFQLDQRAVMQQLSTIS